MLLSYEFVLNQKYVIINFIIILCQFTNKNINSIVTFKKYS